MGKRKGFIEMQYKKSLGFIKEIKNYIYLSIAIFAFYSLIGFFIPLPEEIYQRIFEILEELLRNTEGLGALGLMRFIFLNNIQSAFFAFVFGVFFGIFPIVSSALNGLILGVVASLSVSVGGFAILLRLLPHGIFELPAIFISFGMGLKIGLWLIINPVKFYWRDKKIISFLFILFYIPLLLIFTYKDRDFRKMMKKSYYAFKDDFFMGLKTFVLIVIPLLFVAAIIEGALISLL
jgi:stage II sporulation protein M